MDEINPRQRELAAANRSIPRDATPAKRPSLRMLVLRASELKRGITLRHPSRRDCPSIARNRTSVDPGHRSESNPQILSAVS
jgi:hypothetical protein